MQPMRIQHEAVTLPRASPPGHPGDEAMPVGLSVGAGQAAARSPPGDGRPAWQDVGGQGGRLGPPHEAPAGGQAGNAVSAPAGGAQEPAATVCGWRACAGEARRWRLAGCGQEAADLSQVWRSD